MDAITSLALSLDNPVLKAIGSIIANEFAYAALIVALVFLGEPRNGKRLKILATLAVVLVLGMAIKQAMAQPRPCAGEIWCPADYSFPSTHALVAFTLMIAFLGGKNYAFYLLFALLVSFSRLNTGVHGFIDVAAALPIAVLGYYAADLAWNAVKTCRGPGRGRRPGTGGRKGGGAA